MLSRLMVSPASLGSPTPPDRPVRRIVATRILQGIGVTLGEDAIGWRFWDWHRDDCGLVSLPPPPPAADRERYFETASAATEYFKQLIVG
jgi:hypothetical protein